MIEPHTIKDLFNRIEALEEYFKEYPNALRENTLQELKEKLKSKQTYKIAIVANMSAGKSTLINALFGREILPSFNEATSDCIVEITSMPDIPKKAEVFFENKSPITLEEKDFIELKQYAQKDSKCEDQHKGVEKITLTYPFLHIQNKQESKQENIEILFIDTPGPNNTGNFQDKHKRQTKTALNDVDMALFVFDYGQLDANLESDEQGLWHTIKERKEKDKDFEVFFLLNKVDMAFGDNEKLMKNNKDYSRESEKELTKKYWGRHEAEAIEKLQKAAENHGIQNPQIFALSSYYELLRRMENGGQPLTGDEEDTLETFQKKFKRIFDEKWEQECINYTGFEKLEKAINAYIDQQVVDKILKKNSNEILEILRGERNTIETSIQNFQKPKGEAEENIKKAKEFLLKELPPLQERTQENIAKSKEKAKKQVESTINKWIEQEFTSKVEEIVLKAVIFMHEFVDGNKNPAKQVESILKELGNSENKNSSTNPFNPFRFYTVETQKTKKEYLEPSTLSLENKNQADSIHSKTNEYISSLIENCKNNFLDIQSEIKCHYASLNAQCNESLQGFKSAIEKHLNQALQIEFKEQMQPIAIDYSEALNLSTSIPKSTLRYTFKEARYEEVSDANWWNPFSWFSTKTVKTEAEKHTLTINPKELQQAIANTFIDRTTEFKAMEIKRHQDAISAFGGKTLQKTIGEIVESKTQEINKLGEQLQDTQNNLEKSQRQQKALTNTQEKMGF